MKTTDKNCVKVNKKHIKNPVSQTIIHIILILSLLMVIYPLFMMLIGSFKSGTVYNTNKWHITFPLRISNFNVAFNATSKYLLNTIIVAVIGISGMIFISSMASFSISKLKFIGSKFCFSLVLVITMLPGVLSLTPQLILYKTLGLQNSLFALILPMWTGGCVWGVFLLTSYYSGIPDEIFEAADLDGANDFQKYILVALPLSLPIIATLVIMQINGVWNDFLWPKLILKPENYTIASGLAFQFEAASVSQTVKYAGYVIASIPVVVMFIFFNKFYIEGLVGASVKL